MPEATIEKSETKSESTPVVAPVKIEDQIRNYYAQPGHVVTVRKVGEINFRVNIIPPGEKMKSCFIRAEIMNNQLEIVDCTKNPTVRVIAPNPSPVAIAPIASAPIASAPKASAAPQLIAERDDSTD